MKRYLKTIIFLTLALSGRVSAKTLIVDNRAANASDDNAGTRAKPFQTISAAARRVQPGDTVIVRPGVYREAVHLTVSGTEAKPITFRSEVPYAAIIEGADEIIGSALDTSGVWSFAAPDLAPLGGDPNAGEWIPGEVVYADGVPLTRVKEKAALTPGTFLLDYDAKRVRFAPFEGQTPQRVKIEFTMRAGLLAAEKPIDDIYVRGFTLIHNGGWFGSLHALTICGQRWRVENNRVLWSSYAGIAFRHSNHCVVRNNFVDWSGAENVVGNSTANLLFENNRLLHGNWQRQAPDFEGGALKMVSTFDSVYRNNEAAYFYGYGLWFDIDCGDNTFQKNTIHDSAYGSALFSEISWRTHFYDNIVYNNVWGVTVGESSECDVARNAVFNNFWGVYLRDDGQRKTATEYGRQSRENFEKNLLADVPGLDAARVRKLGADYQKYWVEPPHFQVAYTNVSDNLILDNTIGYTEHRRYGQPSEFAAAIHDNYGDSNFFWADNPEAALRYETGGGATAPYANLAAWQAATGRDLHSVYADPRRAAAPLPQWARDRRKAWDLRLQSVAALDALRLNLVSCPSGMEARGRMARAASVVPFETGDPAIKGFLFDDAGRKTLALWTTAAATRRPLRLKLRQAQVAMEDGYGNEKTRTVSGGEIALHVGYIPVYLHGVGADIAASR